MKRKTLDILLSSASLLVGVVLLLAAGGLYWGYTFIHTQVHDQLGDQKIVFPAAGSKSLEDLPAADKAEVSKYAGEQVFTGAQAEVFADHYIAVHIRNIGGGLTYAELSSKSLANPTDQKLAGQVQTVFRGETLRGMLLNAYAFDTMAIVARYAAFVSLAGGILLILLAVWGFVHVSQMKPTKR